MHVTFPSLRGFWEPISWPKAAKSHTATTRHRLGPCPAPTTAHPQACQCISQTHQAHPSTSSNHNHTATSSSDGGPVSLVLLLLLRVVTIINMPQHRPAALPRLPLLLLVVALAAAASCASAFVVRTPVSKPLRSIRAISRCHMSADNNDKDLSSSSPSSSPPSFSRADLLKRTLAGAASLSFLLLNGGRRGAAFAATTAEEDAAEAASYLPTPAPAPAAAPAAAPTGVVKTAYDYSVPYDGVRVPLANFKGKAVVVCNAKTDDPESLNQIPGLTYLTGKYSPKGLKVWVFTTEQGTFETDEDRVIRIKYYQQYGFGQYPNALIFDKIDVVGKRADPFFKFLCKTLKNPNKIARITLNFEKFLLDANGRPIRRYPRKYTAYDMEEDVKAAVAGLPLPPPSPKLIKAWRDAYVEAERSEYAFKKGLNYYEPLGEDQRNLP